MPQPGPGTVNPDQEIPALFTSARRLAEHRRDPNLVILDACVTRYVHPDDTSTYATGLPTYREGHLPGAIHADLVDDFSDPTAEMRFTRPTREQLADALARHGVGTDSTVVVYDHQNGIWAARLVWVLRSYGFADASVLNGGLDAWRGIGGEIETGDITPAPTAPPALSVQSGYFVDADDVRDLGSDSALVNVLRPEVFSGEEAPYGRAGHIPGSVNLPFAELIDPDGSEIDLDRARRTAESIPPGPVVTYCGSGITASGYALALRASGRDDIRVYDGSMSEWAADPGNPLITS
jgi:thiosulfate/3-mercaptopyruvate sulfurtransferase